MTKSPSASIATAGPAWLPVVYVFTWNSPPWAAPAALALPDKPSIAVLPFENMPRDPEQEHFADGVVEAITAKLIRRHPHVFGDDKARSAGVAKGFWEANKAKERKCCNRRVMRDPTRGGVSSTLNELADLPIYGNEPRVKVKTLRGPWQEVEIRVHSLEEIDTPEFWSFLEQAVAGREQGRVRLRHEDLAPLRNR